MEMRDDNRAYLPVEVCSEVFYGLLDSGATRTCIGGPGWEKLRALGFRLRTSGRNGITVADGRSCAVIGTLLVPFSLNDYTRILAVSVVPSLPKEVYLGMDFWRIFKLMPDMIGGTCLVSPDLASLEETVISRDDLSETQKDELNLLLATFEARLCSKKLGCTTLVEHTIDTGDAKPIKRPSYQFSPKLLETLHAHVDELLEQGVVRPSKSSWSSPVMLVPKKEKGNFRVVVDFRLLNEKTKKDAYPPPRVMAILDSLRNARYISSLDIRSAFFQIPLANDGSIEKTAFSVPGRGLFEFVRMPQGLCNSPATWQRLLDGLLGDLEGVFCYMDDVVIISETFDVHLQLLRTVLQRIVNAGLTINMKKSQFCRSELVYLGYLVNKNGLQVNPDKVLSIVNYPRPKNAKEVHRFCGLTSWYRRFVDNFAHISAPLTNLTKKNVKWKWGKEEEDAFNELKERLINAPLLRCPDFTRPFIIHCDASNRACAAVLTQEYDDGPHVIAYASRMFDPREAAYSVTERECLAVLYGLEHFRGYVEGYKITIVTDHSSLMWLNRMKDPFGRLARWAVRLQQFDYDVVHRKGSENLVPDALSRAFPEEELSVINVDVPPEDEWYLKMMKSVQEDPEGFTQWKIMDNQLFKLVSVGVRRTLQWNRVIPKERRQEVLSSCHDAPTAGHMGVSATFNRVRSLYYWPGMQKEVRSYVNRCQTCLRSKTTNLKPAGLMGIRKEVTQPFEVISCDLLGPLPRSTQGNRSLLVITCYFSKFVVVRPLKKDTAKNVIAVMKNDVFLQYCPPRLLLCDNGPQFKSKEFKSLCQQFGVEILHNFFYHAQTNHTERVNKVIGQMLRSYVTENQRIWDRNLPELQYALRSYVHEVTQFSAFRLVYGYDPLLDGRLRPVKEDPVDGVPECEPRGASPVMNVLKPLWQDVTKRLEKAHQKNAHFYNLRRRPVKLSVGQEVYRRNVAKSNAAEGICAKLLPKYLGPFTIVSTCGRLGYMLEEPATGRRDGPWHVQDLRVPVRSSEQ